MFVQQVINTLHGNLCLLISIALCSTFNWIIKNTLFKNNKVIERIPQDICSTLLINNKAVSALKKAQKFVKLKNGANFKRKNRAPKPMIRIFSLLSTIFKVKLFVYFVFLSFFLINNQLIIEWLKIIIVIDFQLQSSLSSGWLNSQKTIQLNQLAIL